jgi:Leucine-rich repeat (LRR) protein
MFVEIFSKSYSTEYTRSLYLYERAIEVLPEQIFTLVSLVLLDVSDNLLTELPESIGNLVNLTELSVSRNRLTSVPNSIGKLIHLKHLSLSANQLTELPDSISNLINLERLTINDNLLTRLPDSIGKLVNLRSLSMIDNRLTLLPESILDIKNKLIVDESSYQINNLDLECKFIILDCASDEPIDNLPSGLQKVWLAKSLLNEYCEIKLPFGCVIKYF